MARDRRTGSSRVNAPRALSLFARTARQPDDPVETRLAGIEGHPALKMTPAQHGSAMRDAGASIFGDAVSSLHLGAHELWRVKEEVQSLAVTARAAEAQRQAVLWAVGAGVAVGLALFPMLGAFAPGGSFLSRDS